MTPPRTPPTPTASSATAAAIAPPPGGRALAPAAATALLVFFSTGVALYALLNTLLSPLGSGFPEAMAAGFRARPWSLYAHALASALALALGPLQWWSQRTRRLAWHRALGRAYMACMLVGGMSGLHLALGAWGGPLARSGFAVLALAWMGSAALALHHIRRRDVAQHRRWMQRNYALTFAAVTLRLYMPLSGLLGLDSYQSYAVVAWLCWVPNLALLLWWQKYLSKNGTSPRIY
ncbi:MAG: DUF2306 domain-containing protein [Rhodoferax sp.]